MINLKVLRRELENTFGLTDKELNISRKKKMIIENTSNGNVKAVRKNYIKIEIVEWFTEKQIN